jgi:hypothetical protein
MLMLMMMMLRMLMMLMIYLYNAQNTEGSTTTVGRPRKDSLPPAHSIGSSPRADTCPIPG